MTSTSDDIRDVEPGPVVERFLDDYQEGDIQAAGPITVTADEIIAFAKRYDPLPMHLSSSGGQETIHDSLIASGVLTIALKQRLIMSIERNTSIIGAVRIDNQQFLKPVRPGDDLTMFQVCSGTRESKSRPDRGLMFWEFKLTNQKGEIVFSSDDTVMVRRKPTD
ncbi:MAG: acyl dehydratase [Paracoccaceae bacterium]|jgi:acyl dehydratase